MASILLVNDDGVFSPGLGALALALRARHALTIVAPSSQRSWVGKASSYHRQLSYGSTEIAGIAAIELDGTPSDCAVAGIHHFCPERPDLVISGINVGANVGDSYILSSGTIGGALEGLLADIPSLACGVEFSPEETRRMEFEPSERDISRFGFAAGYIARAADALFGIHLSRPLLFNLNFGENAGPHSKLVPATVARYDYGCFLEKRDGGLYHRGSPRDASRVDPGSDMAVVRNGDIALSALVPFGVEDPSADAVRALITAMES